MISLLWAAENAPALPPGQHLVDLSQANMIAGAIVGGFGVTAVFVFIGFLLFKGGLRFHFGSPPAVSPPPPQVVICNDPSKCPGHGTLETKQEANDKAVDILFEKFKGLETKMDEGFTKGASCKSILDCHSEEAKRPNNLNNHRKLRDPSLRSG